MTVFKEFPANYDIRESDLPGTGSDVLYFNRTSLAIQEPSDGIVLEVLPVGGDKWFGNFGSGMIGDSDFDQGIYTTPNPSVACICVGGAGYWLNVARRSKEDIPVFPVRRIRVVKSSRTIVLADFTDLCAYGPSGFQWLNKSAAPDRLEIESVEKNVIRYSGWHPDLGKAVSSLIDLQTGRNLA